MYQERIHSFIPHENLNLLPITTQIDYKLVKDIGINYKTNLNNKSISMKR